MWAGWGVGGLNNVHAPLRKVVWGGWGVGGGGGLNNVHAAWSSLCVLRCRSMAKCNACNVCGFGSDTMKRDDVAVVCVLVLLLRLAKTRIHADGARSWQKAAKRRGFLFSCVRHSKMEFTKCVNSRNALTGTQALDGFWKLLKSLKVCRVGSRFTRGMQSTAG